MTGRARLSSSLLGGLLAGTAVLVLPPWLAVLVSVLLVTALSALALRLERPPREGD